MEPGVLAAIKEKHCEQRRKVTYPSQYYRSASTELAELSLALTLLISAELSLL